LFPGNSGRDSVVEFGIPIESNSNSMAVSDQSRKSAHAVSQRKNDVSNVVACTMGERVASQFVVSTNRGTSSADRLD